MLCMIRRNRTLLMLRSQAPLLPSEQSASREEHSRERPPALLEIRIPYFSAASGARCAEPQGANGASPVCSFVAVHETIQLQWHLPTVNKTSLVPTTEPNFWVHSAVSV